MDATLVAVVHGSPLTFFEWAAGLCGTGGQQPPAYPAPNYTIGIKDLLSSFIHSVFYKSNLI